MKKLLLLLALTLLVQVSLTAQWVSTQGPYGGNVFALKMNEDYVFALKSSGLYRSSDVGLNWESCAAANSFGKIELDGKNLLVSYLNNNFGLMRYSPDNGNHWENVSLPLGTPYIDNFAVKGNTILYSNYPQSGKLWRSDDLGQHWATIEVPGEPFQQFNVLGTFQGRIYLSNYTRLLWSEDGLTWQYLGTVPGSTNHSISSFYREGDVMVSLAGVTLGRSLDGGLNWEPATVELNHIFSGNDTQFSYENGVFYASCRRPLFKSTNNGLSWEYVDINGPRLYYHTSQNNVILGHIFGLGVFRSTDGGQTFNPSNHGLDGGNVLTISLQNNDLWLWDERGIVRQNTNQLDWDAIPDYPVPTLFGSYVSIFHFKNAVFVREDHGDLLRSFDGGQNWSTVTPDASIASSDFVEFNQKGDSLFISSEFYNTYLSTDFGDHWEFVNPHVNSQIGGATKDMAVQRDKFFVTDNQHIYRSDNHLLSWQFVGDSMPFGSDATWVRLFATPNHLFAYVNQERIFRSDDQAESWTEVSIPFPPNFYNWAENEVVFAEIKDAVVAFFERGGVFVSKDKGKTWESFNEGIVDGIATTCFAYNETSLWAGTYLFGLYQRSTNDLVSVSTAEPALGKNALKIFPNPTKGIFSCKLPAEISGEATISVFDLQGKLIFRRTESSAHFQNIDLSPCTTGVYWVQIATVKGVFSGKLIIQ